MDTNSAHSVNPIIKEARWVAAKLSNSGQKVLTPQEKVFIAQLSYRAAVQDDHTARRLVSQLQVAHLEYQLKLGYGGGTEERTFRPDVPSFGGEAS